MGNDMHHFEMFLLIFELGRDHIWPQIRSKKIPGRMCAYKIVNGVVNSKIFARVLIRKTSHMQSFVKIKTSRNVKISLSLTDVV